MNAQTLFTNQFISKQKNGFTSLLTVTVILAIAITIGLDISLLVWNEQKITGNSIKSAEAYYTAESGVEDSLYRILKNKQYNPTNTLAIGNNNTTINITTTNTQKIITSKGTAAQRIKNLEIILTLDTVTPSFHYGAQVGEGGVEMDENSKINGADNTPGNLYSNGPVDGDNNATVTGDVIVATGVSLGEQSATCNTDQITGKTNPQIDFAQSFQAADSKPLTKISLYLKKVSNPGDISIKITNNNNGSPAQTAIAQATLQASLVGQSYAWIDVVFSSPPNLTKNDTYWLILDAEQNSNKYWLWCKDSNNSYTNGSIKYNQDWNHNSWTPATGDLTFKTYLGTGLSSIDDLTVYGNVRANSITDSKICGDAYYQSASSIDSTSKNFLDNPNSHTCPLPTTPGTGYPNQPDPPVAPFPISEANISQWKTDATNGGIINGSYTLNNDSSLGPIKITGDLNITDNKKTLTVTGTIYVQGKIIVGNGMKIKCDASYGANSCVILTDSWIQVNNGGTFSGSGQPNSYLMLLSTLAGCNGQEHLPQCTQNNAAIDLNNNSSGGIFYANNSLIHLDNVVNVQEIVAYMLALSNNSVITYQQGLANAQFSSGPSGGWTITSWKEIP